STRRFGPDGAVKGQQKDFRIPEDVPPIVAPCEPPGANGDMGVAWIGGAVEMVCGEAQGALGCGVAVDLNGAAGPALRPSPLMIRDQACRAAPDGPAER